MVTVSVALIVKNEERTLARCLDSIRGAVDEIVVVDTGSDDATKAMARRYTDVVLDFPWIEDFSAARQFAFDHATGDWVAWLDADDVVLNADRIRPLAAAAPADIAGFSWRYVLGRDAAGDPTFEFWRERCVRNDGAFRWQGRVHEVLVAHTSALLVRSDEVVIEHHPQADRGDVHRGRNLQILEAECVDAGEAVEPRTLFYLGREYADMGQPEQAMAVLRRYLNIAFWDDERYRAQTQIAALLRSLGRYNEAIDAYLAALKVHPCWPDAYLGLAESYYYLRDWPKVIHWADIGRALPLPDTTLFIDRQAYSYRWIIHYTNALYHTGQVEAALAWTRRALELAPNDQWHQRNQEYFAAHLSRHALASAEVSTGAAAIGVVVPERQDCKT